MSEEKEHMDKAKGKTNQVKGQVKEKLGEATDHQNLKAEGKKDQAKGKLQDKKGDVKNKRNH
ncbi:CsbD family protein [Bacillus sp. A015]